jgi:tetratricopeptide (TPR) repeat protein
MTEPLDTTAISAALVLVTEATRLTPDDASVWRVLFEVANMADKPRVASSAIENMLRLYQNSTTAQLARLREVINGAQTVEKRISLYEQLLSDSRRHELDSGVAARLALDSAYLQQKAGDTNQFARWLAESVALDPSYPESMALATGFFGDETADVYRRAELLATSVLANIRDTTTQVTLAEFLMSFGDYQDAKELYEIILGNWTSSNQKIDPNLLADVVLSQWASGDVDAAIDTLIKEQTRVDVKFRAQTKVKKPRLTPLELARIHAPLVPKLSAIRAAIYAQRGDVDTAEMALDAATGSLLALSKLYQSKEGEANYKSAENYIQAAWLELWLGSDTETVATLIQKAETLATIDPTEKQRLEGWTQFRNGDLAQAKQTLSQCKEDPSSKVGLALVYLAQGNKRDAALELLSVAKKQGGTLLGVWSKNKLQEIVGSNFDLRPEVAQLRELMSGVLQTLYLFVRDPRPPVAIQIIPTKQTYEPYTPIMVQLTVTNNTTIPLTISNNGPIKPVVLVEANLVIPGSPRIPSPPIIVPIDTEISIKPRKSVEVTVDLRKHWIGGVLNTHPLNGSTISLKATVNFSAREVKTREGNKVLVYEAGSLGAMDATDAIRIDGVRLTDTWIQNAINEISDITDTQKLITLVLLTWSVGDNVVVAVEEPVITPPVGEEPFVPEEGERHPLQDEAVAAILTQFPKLDTISQAWVLSTMSNDSTLEAVNGMVKKPDSTMIQLAKVIRFASPPVPDETLDNHRLLDAMQLPDQNVSRVANWVYEWVENIVKMRAEQLTSN